MFDRFLKTSQHALHWLRTNPRFAIPAVLSLALGFGGTAVMFSVMYYTMFPKQPYRDPDRIMSIRMLQRSTGTYTPSTTADYNDWKVQNAVFESTGLFLPLSQTMTITGGTYPDRILYQYATASMFPLLGIRPQLGVTFAEKRSKDVNGVMLADGFWRRRFNADPNVVGSTIQLGGHSYEVVGVMPRDFRIGGVETDVWRETDPTGVLNERRIRWLMGAGRLKPGVTPAQAQANLAAIGTQLAQQYPETNKGWDIIVTPLSTVGVAARTSQLYPFAGAVLFVLLIACTNVAGLLIAHVAGRRKELATRAALGANRGRLVRQLLAESVALSVVSAVVGMMVARWWLALLVAYVPIRFDFVKRASFDLPVFLFIFAVSLTAGLIMGLVVAWRSSKPDVNATLKQNSGGLTSGRRQRTLSVLAVAEIALAFVLLVGAGLLMRSFVNLRSVPLGFDGDNLLTAEVDLSGPTYRGQIFRREIAMVPVLPAVPRFYERLVEELSHLPSVESVGLGTWLPLAQGGSGRRGRTIIVEGHPDPGRGARPQVMYNAVTPGFFSALRLPLVHGRLINDRDTFEAPWVTVINQAMAKQLWPGQDPIGKTVTLDIVTEEQPRTVVGVVADVNQFLEAARPARAEMYVNLFQQPTVYPGDGAQNRFRMAIVMRARPSPSLIDDLRRTVTAIDPAQPVFQVRTMDEIRGQRDAPSRFMAVLIGSFAVLGTLLAALGVFALVSYAAANRAQEFGIRMALGATTGMLLRTLLVWAATVAGMGIFLGVLLAWWQAGILQSTLYGVTPLDVATFIAAALLIVTVALGAAAQSARRVRRLEAVTVLRGA